MKTFFYRAKDNTGKSIKGYVEANSLIDAHTMLAGKKVFPLVLAEKKSFNLKGFDLFNRVKQEELIIFTEQLSTLISSGITITETLDALAEQTDNKHFKQIIVDIRERIESGSSIKDAFEKHNSIFKELYVQLIGLGEASGNLDVILDNQAKYLEKQDEIRKKISQAFAYPKFAFFTVMGVVIFLITFIVPKFVSIFLQVKTELPLPTRMLLSLRNLLVNRWYLLLIIILSVYLAWRFIYSTRGGKLVIDKYKLKIPIFGRIIRYSVFSRFAHSFSLTLMSGIDLISSLEISSKVVVNSYIMNELKNIRDDIQRGKSISESMSKSKVIPKVMVQAIKVGEKSGNLTYIVDKVGELWDRNLDFEIKNIASKIEPAMVILLGGIVLMIALAIYLPLFELPSTIRNF